MNVWLEYPASTSGVHIPEGDGMQCMHSWRQYVVSYQWDHSVSSSGSTVGNAANTVAGSMADDSAAETAARQVIQECSRALRALKRKTTREQQPLENRCGGDTMLMAALICNLTDNVQTAIWFVIWHSRCGYFNGSGNMTIDREGLEETVQELRGGTALRELLNHPQSNTLQRAARWIAEWHTFQWMFALNVRGIAPSSSDVREAYLQEIPELVRPALAGHMSDLRLAVQVQKDWAVMYRRRWGLQYKTLGMGHDMTPEEIRTRVP